MSNDTMSNAEWQRMRAACAVIMHRDATGLGGNAEPVKVPMTETRRTILQRIRDTRGWRWQTDDTVRRNGPGEASTSTGPRERDTNETGSV